MTKTKLTALLNTNKVLGNYVQNVVLMSRNVVKMQLSFSATKLT